MTAREWALVVFTLLMQTSVGVVLVATALNPFVSRFTMPASERPFDLPLFVAAITAGLGLAVSLAHLGQPLDAWLAVANVRTSWLSREIVLALLFAAAVAGLAILGRAGSPGTPAMRAASVAAAALGVAAVYAMSRLYMVPAQPAWNRIVTPVGFFATALVLGILVVLVCPALKGGPYALALKGGTYASAAASGTYVPALTDETYVQRAIPFARLLVVRAIVFLVVQVVLLPTQLGAVAQEPANAISAYAGHTAAWLAVARGVSALAVAILLGTALRATSPAASASVLVAALILGFASELLGRVLFYASSVRI